ncbi:MAG: hypothetical protein N2038_13475 [Geminicoccaceae bacterium]|nr:hypothetical protein [Geminicoccaceae bacterium]MCS7267890.1 hypothetical protein [Geminicoccaceae bacterium]MCX7631244.1 hypothetical protein [Geminicoccaceae bacterium]MDW8124480.1 hypothetical protein [Geminicoccaceae bacterium]MDW8342596.1 hypothetical protein [Geminicoccaceae bacterium]
MLRRLVGFLLLVYLLPATAVTGTTLGALMLRGEPPESLKRCLAAGRPAPDVTLFALRRGFSWPRELPERLRGDPVRLFDWLLVRSDPFPEACRS